MNALEAQILTLADVMHAVDGNGDLPARKKAEILSAIRTVVSAANRTPKEVLAHTPEVNRLIEETPWKALGLASGSISNKISLLRTGLRIAGLDVDRQRRKLAVNDEWNSVMATVPERYRAQIAPFANWASGMGFGIDDIDVATFERYWAYLEERTLQKNKRERWLAARRAWNAWLRHVRPDRRQVELDRPLRPRSHPWIAFPSELFDEVTVWREWAGHVDFEERERRPLKKLTLDGYVYAFRRIATLLVDDGVDPAELTRLDAYLVAGRPKRVRQLVQGDASVKEARDRLRTIFCALLAAARWLEVVRPEALTGDCRAGVDYAGLVIDKIGRRRKMAESNKTKLAKLRDPRIGGLFSNLAAIVAERHANNEVLSVPNALELQMAALHVILQEAPFRIGEVVALDLDKDVIRPLAGADGPWMFFVSGEKTKTGRPNNLKLSKFGSRLVADYVGRARPLLKSPTPALFISQNGTRKTRATLSTQYAAFTEREIGYRVNAHLNRHICASRVIRETKGDFTRASKILGHADVETTSAFYSDFDSEVAQETWHDMLDRDRSASGSLTGSILAGALARRRIKK